MPNGKRDSEGQDIMEPVMTLLTCTTLPHDDSASVASEDDEVQLAATKFNAETHVRLFKQTFENLGIGDISNFVIGQIADSTALNPKIARLLKFNHIACRNHCLNLGCKDMESNCVDLQRLADSVTQLRSFMMLAAENPEILLSYASKFLLVHLNYNIIMCYYSSSSFVLSSWKWQDQYRLIKSWKI